MNIEWWLKARAILMPTATQEAERNQLLKNIATHKKFWEHMNKKI
jgi:hypothetical protein